MGHLVRISDPPAGEQVNAVCPECGEVLSQRVEAGVARWECPAGHRYSPDALIDAQADSVDGALRAAVRATWRRPARAYGSAGRVAWASHR